MEKPEETAMYAIAVKIRYCDGNRGTCS